MNAASWTIPTATITETKQLIYATAAVNSHKEQHLSWKRRVEAEMKAAQMEVSRLQKGGIKMSIPEALETAAQRLKALTYRLNRCVRKIEARTINQNHPRCPLSGRRTL